jgi:O-antigen/teichoic acid export membrane protein
MLETGSIVRRLANAARQLAVSPFAWQTGGTLATRAGLLATGLVASIVAARVLGPEGRGMYAVALALVASTVQFGNLGLPSANAYYLAKDRALLPALLGNSLAVGIGAAGLLATAAAVLFWYIPVLAPVPWALAALALSLVPVELSVLLLLQLCLGRREIRLFNLAQLFPQVGGLAVMAALAWTGRLTPESLLLLGIVSQTVALVWLLRHLRSRSSSSPVISGISFLACLRYGLKAYTACLFMFLVLRFDLFMVTYFRGAAEAGQYSVSVAMGELVLAVPTVVGMLAFPALTALPDVRQRWETARKVLAVAGFAVAVTAPMLGWFADEAVQFLFGPAYRAAVPPLLWLLPGLVCLGLNTVFMNYFAANGMPAFTILSPAFALVVNVALNAFFVPRWGAVGAAAASSIAYALMLAASVAYVNLLDPRLACVKPCR